MGKQAAPRKVGDKEALAVGNTIRGSAQKLNLVAAMIRGKKVEHALNLLKFSPTRRGFFSLPMAYLLPFLSDAWPGK